MPGAPANIERLGARLDDLYERQGIHPTTFRCGHHAQCSAGVEDSKFTEARMPSIGRRYLDEVSPRIAVLSLDSGSGEPEAANRLVRIQEKGVVFEHGNRHWARTHDIVRCLVTPFLDGVTREESTEHFIHLNSVKCSANLPNRRQAPWHMFMNCRWYLPDEIRAVAPEIIVSQGDRARNALWGAFPTTRVVGDECSDDSHKCWARIIEIDGVGKALWLHTYHPNQKGGLYHQSLNGYETCYPKWVEDFVEGRMA